MNFSDYRLPEGSFFCLADDYVVFSNIDNDKYHCLSPDNTRIFVSCFVHPRDSESCRPEALRIAQALARQGLIARGAAEATRPLEALDIPAPSAELADQNCIPPNRLGCREGLPFIQASLCASFKLKFCRLGPLLRAIEKRRQFGARNGDPEELRTIVATFGRLRPYFPRAYLCRFDSLALLEFLAIYGHYPLWIFGVKSKPFGAHCWVQDGNLLLNDRLEYVNRFTRIMAF